MDRDVVDLCRQHFFEFFASAYLISGEPVPRVFLAQELIVKGRVDIAAVEAYWSDPTGFKPIPLNPTVPYRAGSVKVD